MKRLYIFVEINGFRLGILDTKNKKFESKSYHPFKNNQILKNEEYRYLSDHIVKKIQDIGVDNEKIEDFIIIIQDTALSIKEVEVLGGLGKKEVDNILDIEMTQNFKIDMQEFEKQVLDKDEKGIKNLLRARNKNQDYEKDLKKLGVLIFPKKYAELAKEISIQSGIFCAGMYLEYQILQEYLFRKNIQFCKKLCTIKLRREDIVLVIFNEDGLTSSVAIENSFVDDELMEYVSNYDRKILVGDFENIKYEFLSEKIDGLEIDKFDIQDEVLFIESILGRKSFCMKNYFREKTRFTQVLKYINSMLALFLAFSIVSALNVYSKNISLQSEFKSISMEKHIRKNNEVGVKKKDISKILGILKLLSGRIVHLSIDEQKLDIECRIKNIGELKTLVESGGLKNFSIRSIEKIVIKDKEPTDDKQEKEESNKNLKNPDDIKNKNEKVEEKNIDKDIAKEKKQDDKTKEKNPDEEYPDKNSFYEEEVIDEINFSKDIIVENVFEKSNNKVESLNLSTSEGKDESLKQKEMGEYEIRIKIRMMLR